MQKSKVALSVVVDGQNVNIKIACGEHNLFVADDLFEKELSLFLDVIDLGWFLLPGHVLGGTHWLAVATLCI